MSRPVRVKGSFRRRMMARERPTLIPWASTVAQAAPTVPRWNTATSSRSPRMLATQAMDTERRGITESPSPRNMLPSRL